MVKKSKKKQLAIVSFAVGDFVFVKIKGSKPWPSIIRETEGQKVLADFICPEKTWYVNSNPENVNYWNKLYLFHIIVIYLLCLIRTWSSTIHVQPFSENLVNKLRRENPKNIKLLRSIDEMLISIEKMKERIVEEMAKTNEPAAETRCLRSTKIDVKSRNAAQVTFDAPSELPSKVVTRNNSKTKKKDTEIETESRTASQPDGKKHFLRSRRKVSDLMSEQQENAAKRRHEVSSQPFIDSQDPPQKRARKTKTIISITKQRVNSPIAARTRSHITKQGDGK